MIPDHLVTYSQARQILKDAGFGHSSWTVESRINDGTFAKTIIGCRRYLDRKQVEAYKPKGIGRPRKTT